MFEPARGAHAAVGRRARPAAGHDPHRRRGVVGARSRCSTRRRWVEELDAGDEIVVVGPVRRRFFRAAGATASRVEVEADVDRPGALIVAGCGQRFATPALDERVARRASTADAQRQTRGSLAVQ